jgi:hypothetical protein
MSVEWEIFNWTFWITLLLLLLLAVVSLWLWGGARRGGLGHLMAGALLLVSGAVFLYVLQINVFARMDNSYLANVWFGSYFMFLGVTLLIGSLASYGVRPWLAALLWVASAAFALFGVSWLGSVAAFLNGGILLYTALLLGSVLLYIVAHGYLVEAIIAAALTTLGFAQVWWIAGGTMRAFTPVTIVADEHFYKPPLLDDGPLFVCLILATVHFFIGRFIQGRLRGQRPPVPAVAALD